MLPHLKGLLFGMLWPYHKQWVGAKGFPRIKTLPSMVPVTKKYFCEDGPCAAKFLMQR
jgi:hypothetical protein